MDSKISPSLGHIVAGTILNEHTFEGKVKAAQLFQFAEDPRRTEDERIYRANPMLHDQRRLRMEVQRLFSGEKKKNVDSYSDYIVSLHLGEVGLTPTIVLWTSAPLVQEEREHGMAQLMIPFEERLIAIDGETQLAARYVAREKDPETAKDWVAVKICHGRNVTWARQVFHDLNVLGVHPNAALAISMDARDPVTSIARDVEEAVPLFRGRINKVRRQLTTKETDVMTITSLRGACVTLAEGIAGVRYGSSPVAIPKEKVARLRQVAVEWFTAVADKLGPAIEDRERTLAGAPPVMAALGAIGHVLVEIDDADERGIKLLEQLGKLDGVDWEKGRKWEGIAGKFTPKGKFSLGGPKETAYAIYAALTDSTSEGFRRVRGLPPVERPTAA